MTTETKTEYLLFNWRSGQTQAERLCAGLLLVAGYEKVRPQQPLGGPDGRKDLVCRRDGKMYVAAVFFPCTEQSRSDIRNKFLQDIEGGASRSSAMYAFLYLSQSALSSQRATAGFRGSLAILGS